MFSMAVDFDGTLCEDNFPEIGDPRNIVIDLVKRLQAAGVRTVLWTCRRNDNGREYLTEAVEWCKQRGVFFDAVNENLPEVQAKWGGDTRKVMVDYYLDDKCVGQGMISILTALTIKAENIKRGR